MTNPENPTSDKTQISEWPMLALKGFMMGTADVIPGVSGGTLALITGIYERLINAIKSFDKVFLTQLVKFQVGGVLGHVHWKFLVALLAGVFAAVVFFTRIISLPDLMFHYPEPVYGLFFGLIAGSIYILVRSVQGIRPVDAIWVVAGAAFGLGVVTLVPADTPENLPFIFLSGSIAISAMILPGISGSFILLILRKYSYILGQVSKIGGPETGSAVTVLGVFALGMVTGIAIFSRFLSWLLARFRKATLLVLTGFLVGSLFVIWPFQQRDFAETERAKTYAISDPLVSSILKGDKALTNRTAMEFYFLGEKSGDQVQVVHVKKKLIKSRPFWPSFGESTDTRIKSGSTGLWSGFALIFAGLLLVLAIERLRGD